jgi:YidC/Oxa1 family membrane protein insertase
LSIAAASSALSGEDSLGTPVAAPSRIAIETSRLRGSINLRGGRIDDLSLVRFRETADPNSPIIVLFSPSGTPGAFYAETGWLIETTNTPAPAPDEIWKQEGDGTLGVDHPVTLTFDNSAGLLFRRTITIDDHYLFTIKDEVQNKGASPVTLLPYALISRHGAPQVQGLYILHEGFVGYFGDQGLKEYTYKDVDRAKAINFIFTNGWLGITDKYWASALLPDTNAESRARFSSNDLGSIKAYQADYLQRPQTIGAGDTAAANTRLFAGAKEAAVVGVRFPLVGLVGYDQLLGLNHFDLLIDWGYYSFLPKLMFLALAFFFRFFYNYGIAILLVSVLIKLLVFPLAHKSYVTMAKSKASRDALIGSDHAHDVAKQTEKRVKPAVRVLFIAIQAVVVFSLYKVLFVNIEMRYAPFFGWIHDLLATDPTNIFDVFQLISFDPTTLPILGPLLHLGISSAIMGIVMWVQINLNSAPVDPTQKVIFNWTPAILCYAVTNSAAGLVIYLTWNSVLSATHQSLIMRRYGAKIDRWEDIKRIFARPNAAFSDFQRSFLTRRDRTSTKVPTSLRIARRIGRMSRVTFWFSAVFLLILRSTASDDTLLLIGVFSILMVLAVVVYLIALRIGQALAGREYAAVLAGDIGQDRPVILFLRSFDIAQSSLLGRFKAELSYVVKASFSTSAVALVADPTVGFVDRSRYEVEENLDNAIGLNAMFIAIGDKLASYGAAKIIVREQDWQETFYRLASGSRLIFMMPGPSAALLWELSQIVRSPALLDKAVFIMPREGQKQSLAETWEQVTRMAAELGVNLPSYSSEGCCFRLLASGCPGEIVALEPVTRALRKFVKSPMHADDFAKILKPA